MSLTNLDIDVPTLLSPLGGENFTHETIQISWEEPLSFASQSSGLYWYEILFSVDTTDEDDREWVVIAVVPVGNSEFSWKISSKIRSDKCRIVLGQFLMREIDRR